MASKHEQIIQHIISLEIGHKISVRQIAKDLNVSDGTAYRAIKEAENQGLVSTIERVGTIRIERKKKENFERLTFAEVINIVDGQVLGGREGLHKTLSKFVIGAMQLDAMMRYTEAGSLLIVGNRIKAHELALKEGAAVLITGGFDTEDYIKRLADERQLPIISTSYDTFTVAAMINRAIYDQLIKKEIVLVGDIFTPFERSFYLRAKDTIHDWYELNHRSTHTRFPVVDEKKRVIGMATSKDIIGKENQTTIEKVMSRHPKIVQTKTSLASVAHMMVWEGIEVMPVADESNHLQGVISRQDVLKALQQIQRQPQVGETIDDIVSRNLREADNQKDTYLTTVAPQMTNQLGTLSNGVFTSLITEASRRMLLQYKKGDLVAENLSVYFIKPVQIDSTLKIKPKLLEIGRMYAKIDVEVFDERKLVGKGLLMAQLINR
ncbi:MAG: DRTGG domain-containing protein [Bacillota bacterium]|uniref:CBS domain-containing protein n=1 Tax=Virgibacillus salarius TaxID=447199 RepID=A0A941IAX6_9BACI|nr:MULTISPECIES: DRTGG domain-containing protein [Bacillaceae]NAZ08539.1 CBS domain-containing protein [Agaribacter marinus]MBR7795826.1 CBS domain-containing protein [Virgibacillus salarius]MCC2250197.1 CBS domain-containing protein [Virgibacillus sp. AGTR]MDY7044271.1 DRTGG domain-containing protein [Virgibacillus sp. M23]QRZ17697.1 CBS domain-containing protein [Virgibacillus sp. AGTR]